MPINIIIVLFVLIFFLLLLEKGMKAEQPSYMNLFHTFLNFTNQFGWLKKKITEWMTFVVDLLCSFIHIWLLFAKIPFPARAWDKSRPYSVWDLKDRGEIASFFFSSSGLSRALDTVDFRFVLLCVISPCWPATTPALAVLLDKICINFMKKAVGFS